MLRRELWARGLRYRLHVARLPGRPDIVFPSDRIVVFCDGDFWHGRDLANRLEHLTQGSNPTYWTAKIRGNVERDSKNTSALQSSGWTVLRLWETDIVRFTAACADRVELVVRSRRRERGVLIT